MMVDLNPLLNGYYKATGSWYFAIHVDGNKGTMFEPSASNFEVSFNIGEFGEADPEVATKTGGKMSNIEFSTYLGKELGVISEDGLRIVTKGVMGISELEWITEEAFAALEVESDPIEAPPGPYKIQPEYQGYRFQPFFERF